MKYIKIKMVQYKYMNIMCITKIKSVNTAKNPFSQFDRLRCEQIWREREKKNGEEEWIKIYLNEIESFVYSIPWWAEFYLQNGLFRLRISSRNEWREKQQRQPKKKNKISIKLIGLCQEVKGANEIEPKNIHDDWKFASGKP